MFSVFLVEPASTGATLCSVYTGVFSDNPPGECVLACVLPCILPTARDIACKGGRGTAVCIICVVSPFVC